MNGKYELNENELDAVIGGAASPTPAPTPTGEVTYICPNCGMAIHASARDTTVTCPKISCRSSYSVENGKLVPAMTRPAAAARPVGI